jgi:hypothetical protein
MAEKRMFAKTIVLSDAFLDMPLTARCLYFTLGMLADDDGFVNNPKGVMRQCGASEDDLRVLLSKKFLLAFESGVIVIKHWRINNYLRNDRYHETAYISEKNELLIDEQGIYHKTDDYEGGIPSSGIPREDKIRLDKNSIKVLDKSNTMSDFSSPTQKNTSKKPSDIDKVVESWNKLSAKGLNRVTKINPTTNRGKMLKARLKEYSLDDVLKAIDNVKQSDFLLGNNNRGWMITFDWFVKPNNFVKVLEGNYNNTKPSVEVKKPTVTDHKDTKSAAMEIFGEF